MVCRKCQAPKEQGKRCGECHKRRCRAWHERFLKAGVPKVVDVYKSAVTGETLVDKGVMTRADKLAAATKLKKPALKPRKAISVSDQKRLDKNAYERARRARKRAEAAARA